MNPLLCCLGVVLAAASPEAKAPLLGAIRWDAWHTPVGDVEHREQGGPVRAMERSLGPKEYHFRLPFFAEVMSDNEVRIGGYTQAIMDQEIAFARKGGLDYWAFLLYEEDNSMSQGLSLYLSSRHKTELPFCAIASPNTFQGPGQFHARMKRILRLMAEPSYLTVANGRPLLYLFRVSDEWIEAWGGEEAARGLFDTFRQAVQDQGQKAPYIVIMNDTIESGAKMLEILGADALTAYAVPGGGGHEGATYAELTGHVREFWEAGEATGHAVVPPVMAGWDRRPRIVHPVPWEAAWQQPGQGMDRYYALPTPPELAAHVKGALDWVAERQTQCPAQAVIVYAWNEHDEGGWLCPTLNADGTPNTERLDAIAAMRHGNH